MSLLFATGFGLTTTVSHLFEASTATANVMIGSYGRNGGQGIRLVRAINRPWARKNLGVNASTIIIGFAVRIVSTSGNGDGLCAFLDAGTKQAGLTVDSDGTVRATGTPSTFNLPIGAYHYVEVKCVIGNSGSWVVRLDGVEVLNETGVDTQVTGNAYATQASIGDDIDRSWDKYCDDLVIMDGTDATATQGAPFNDFLGDITVDEDLPTGDGDSSQFTPSAGSNYQCVDETSVNDDTDYVSSSTVGHKDLYTFPNLPVVTGAVRGVIVAMRTRKDDAGTRTLKAKVKHGGVEGDGPDLGQSTDYAYSYSVFGQNPSTTDDWAIAEVNATQVGVEVVA